MNKELQDLAWRVCPAEFREEVNKIYNADDPLVFPEENELLDYIFGEHNLTSDAEGEEMLTCEKSDVQGFYQEALELIDRGERNNYLNDKLVGIGQKDVLYALFGSKCLPDEKVSDCLHLQGPKPAEPKFKAGDIAVVRGFKHPLLKSDGAIVTILSYHEKGDFYSVALSPNIGIDLDAKFLEPYTETTDKNPKENAKTFAFDRILKDGFSKERRLNIAAMITAGIYSNDKAASQFNSIEALVRKALDITDTLITDSEHTDKKKGE